MKEAYGSIYGLIMSFSLVFLYNPGFVYGVKNLQLPHIFWILAFLLILFVSFYFCSKKLIFLQQTNSSLYTSITGLLFCIILFILTGTFFDNTIERAATVDSYGWIFFLLVYIVHLIFWKKSKDYKTKHMYQMFFFYLGAYFLVGLLNFIIYAVRIISKAPGGGI